MRGNSAPGPLDSGPRGSGNSANSAASAGPSGPVTRSGRRSRVRRSACAAPPARDPGVVAGTEHLGNGEAPELGRARVLRVLEAAVAERLLGRRRLVAQDSRQQSGDRLDHDQRRAFAAGEDEIADRHLAVAQMVGDPLVDALVPTADQREAVARRQLPRPFLIEPAAARRQQEQGPRRLRGLDGGEQRLRRHHHPGTPTERLVVDTAVAVGREGARIVQPHVDHTRGARPAEQ